MACSRRSFLLGTASLWSAALGAFARAGAIGPMRVTHYDNIPPFSWADDTDTMRGLFVDVLDEALTHRLGIPLIHRGYPWVRAQKLVRDGEADAFCTVPTPERRAYTLASTEAIMTVTFKMYAQRGNPVVERLKRVKRIGDLRQFVVAAYLGSGWAHEKLAGQQIDWAPNPDSVLKKLAGGRNDVFVDAVEVQRKRIKALGLENKLIELPQTLDRQTYNLCIGKQSPFAAVMPKFDRTLRQMRDDGSLSALYRKYDLLPIGKK
jgi:polar amino acid transport system substrate-binding protein